MSLNLPHFIAHRGLRTQAPENTLAAFQLAYDAGFSMFECDVQLSCDDVPVIFHDDDVKRTTDGMGLLRNMTYASLQRLDAGSSFSSTFSGEPIPSLIMLLEWLREHPIGMNLELKGRQRHLASVVAKTLKPYLPLLADRILISSFEFEALVDFKNESLDLPLGLLVNYEGFIKKGLAGIDHQYKTLGAYSLNVADRLVKGGAVSQFLKISPRILVYTVNDPARAKALFEQGVCGVFTDGQKSN